MFLVNFVLCHFVESVCHCRSSFLEFLDSLMYSTISSSYSDSLTSSFPIRLLEHVPLSYGSSLEFDGIALISFKFNLM